MVELFGRMVEEERARAGWLGPAKAWWRGLRDLARPLPVVPAPPGPPGGRPARRPWTALGEDLGYAWRSLRHDRGFALAVIGVLGAALALNVAVFSVVNAYLLRPLPYPAADRVVNVRPVTDLSWRQVGQVLEKAVSWDLDAFTLVGEGRPYMARGAWITPDFLDVYGVRAARGRTFRAADADPGAEPVAMISHRLWQERFAGDPAVVGRSFQAFTSDRPDHAESFRIVGVLPADFWHFNDYTEVLAPIRVDRAVYAGRLPVGVRREGAEAALTELARTTGAGLAPGTSISLVPAQEAYVAPVRPVLAVVQGAALLVLLIAFANSLVLVMVRSSRREREVGVRRALGAGRGRLMRQFGVEGVVLAAGAAVVGSGLAVLLLEATRAGLERSLGRGVPGGVQSVSLDPTVLAGAGAGALAAACLFTLVPALLLLGREHTRALASSRGTTESRPRRRLRGALVVCEVALSTALLAGAGLMVRTAVHLQEMELGFETRGVTRGSVGLRQASYPDPADRVAFFEAVLREVERLPGVVAAGVGSTSPFAGLVGPVPVEGEAAAGTSVVRAVVTSAEAGYFRTLGVPVRSGRIFDGDEAVPSAVVSEGLAASLWPDRDPVGRRIRLAPAEGHGASDEPGPWLTVLGVVGDVTRDLRGLPSNGELYTSYHQGPGFWANLLVRTAGAPVSEEAVGAVLARLDPDVPYSSAAELESLVAAARAPTRFTAALLAAFSALALGLALVGLYGVVAYAARQRRRDVAVRMALGADATSVTGLFVRQGMAVVALGVVLGAGGGLVLGRALAGQLRGVGPHDPWTHGAVAAALLLTAALAVWIPARRASRAAPMAVLREE